MALTIEIKNKTLSLAFLQPYLAVAVFPIKCAAHTQGPGWLGLVPVSAIREAASHQAAGHSSSSWSFGPCRGQEAGLCPGAQRSLALGTRSQGHSALTLCTAVASRTACELDIQKSPWGRETGPWCGSWTERGLSSFSGIFYKPKDGLPGTTGTGAGLGEFALLGVHGAPHPVSPLQAVGSQARGQGVEIQAG